MDQERQQKDLEQFQHRSIPLPSLREVRQCEALSQRQLADMAGVSPNTVRLLETGRRRAYPSTLRKLSAALGVPAEKLVREPRHK